MSTKAFYRVVDLLLLYCCCWCCALLMLLCCCCCCIVVDWLFSILLILFLDSSHSKLGLSDCKNFHLDIKTIYFRHNFEPLFWHSILTSMFWMVMIFIGNYIVWPNNVISSVITNSVVISYIITISVVMNSVMTHSVITNSVMTNISLKRPVFLVPNYNLKQLGYNKQIWTVLSCSLYLRSTLLWKGVQ